MSDDGTVFLTGQGTISVAFRRRSAYVGFRAFGGGEGAVLLDPGVARALRSAAEFATAERRIAGGLLYGRHWTDNQGGYLVVSRFLEAGPGEDRDDRLPGDGFENDDFTLSPADLRLLRDDAARMYTDSLEVGWWRTLGALGDFGPRDFLTQLDLVGPGGVGLLVYGSGLHWGTAYLGPDGLEPDSAGTLAAVAGLAPDDTEPEPEPELVDIADGESMVLDQDSEPDQEPELVDIADGESMVLDQDSEPDQEPAVNTEVAGTSVATRRQVVPAPRPTGPRAISPVRVPAREWGSKPANPSLSGPETPTDVKIVIGGLIVAFVAAAVIIGILMSSVVIAVIAAVVFILIVLGFVWLSHL